MDGIDNLKLEVTPDPAELKEDEVLVKINCVSLNNRDLQRTTLDFLTCSIRLTDYTSHYRITPI